MPVVEKPKNEIGDHLVDFEEKVFEDVKAEPGQKALVTFHTVAFEGSIGLVNLLQATRLQRKGFETSVLLYGPGVTLGVMRGFPRLGDEAFPGHQNFNNQIKKFMGEGGKVYACRFALQALYGHGEGALIEGIRPISPLDVLDVVLLHKQDNAVIIDTWTLCSRFEEKRHAAHRSRCRRTACAGSGECRRHRRKGVEDHRGRGAAGRAVHRLS
jgi:uncharacterized repeat protein (TIGR04044 family)